MPTLTSGRLNVTPCFAAATVGLDELRDALDAVKPDNQNMVPGWGAVDTDDHGIGDFGAAAPISSPVVAGATGDFPRRLFARFYYWVTDTRPSVRLLNNPTPGQTHYLDAVDVIASEDAGGLLLLLSTRADQDLGRTVHALAQVLHALDHNAVFDVNARTSLYFDDDIFLWLIERKLSEPTVSPGVTIAGVTNLDTRDNRDRVNVLRDDIDNGRSSFLTSVADGDRLGPLRFVIRLPDAPAKLTLSLWRDGSFAVLKSATHYGSAANVANEWLQATQDLAYKLLPLLRDLHSADQDWFNARRIAFIEAARNQLSVRYSARP